jgi:hypothetical protein
MTQRYQQVEGTYASAGGTPEPVKGSLRGTAIALTIGGTEYEGTVNGNTIEGAIKPPAAGRTLVATRVE